MYRNKPDLIGSKMRAFISKLSRLFVLQVRFAASGLVATVVDYGLYLLLVNRILAPVPANIVSYAIAVVLNFILQRRFVFELKRPGYLVFVLSQAVSAGGLAISTAIIQKEADPMRAKRVTGWRSKAPTSFVKASAEGR